MSHPLIRRQVEHDAPGLVFAAPLASAVETRTDRPGPPRGPVGPLPPLFDFRAAVDVVLAALLGVLAVPFVLASAVLIKLTSPGPVFYSQTRVGLNGREFRILKLRTMRHNCEAVSGVRWATAGDPRITPVGAFLRRTHLDELPQLWNVLRGDMALVGPRPERPEFVTRLAEALPDYTDRLAVRPGVTGLAQVQLPADTDLDSVRLKLAYDLYYIDRAGLWLDARLMLSTALKMLHLPFAVSRLVLRIPAPVIDSRVQSVGPAPADKASARRPRPPVAV